MSRRDFPDMSAPVLVLVLDPPAKPRPLPWQLQAFLVWLAYWPFAIVAVALLIAAAVFGLVALLLHESAQRLRRGCW